MQRDRTTCTLILANRLTKPDLLEKQIRPSLFSGLLFQIDVQRCCCTPRNRQNATNNEQGLRGKTEGGKSIRWKKEGLVWTLLFPRHRVCCLWHVLGVLRIELGDTPSTIIARRNQDTLSGPTTLELRHFRNFNHKKINLILNIFRTIHIAILFIADIILIYS